MMCVVREEELVPMDNEKLPPYSREPRTERIMRRAMATVSTAAIEVTIVLMESLDPSGFTTNQNKTLIMLMSQVDCKKRWSAVIFLKRIRNQGAYGVKTETITEHEFPVSDFTSVQRIKRARKSKDELKRCAGE